MDSDRPKEPLLDGGLDPPTESGIVEGHITWASRGFPVTRKVLLPCSLSLPLLQQHLLLSLQRQRLYKPNGIIGYVSCKNIAVATMAGFFCAAVYTQGDRDVISMPAGFRRHLVGKTLINVFHCDSAEIHFVGKIVIVQTFS